jgi:hypothetical protein
MLIAFSDTDELVTLRVAEAVCVNEPLTPVTVIVELPMGVLIVVVIVSVEVPDVEIDAGEKAPLAPTGRPANVKFTAPVKPLSAPTATL